MTNHRIPFTRNLLLLVTFIFLGYGISACGGSTPAREFAGPAAEEALSAEASSSFSSYGEAPLLAEKVAAGELPSVDERLPIEPVVAESWEYVGAYGDILVSNIPIQETLRAYGETRLDDPARVATLSELTGIPNWDINHLDLQWLRIFESESLIRWVADCSGLVPNLARSWDVDEDMTEFTLFLREGVKWSDGEPFTADDILFWYEDVLLNAELSPTMPAWLMMDGEPFGFDVIDDYTAKFIFSQPNELFLPFLATTSLPVRWPRHYAEQFHVNYVDRDLLENLSEQEGFSNWTELFHAKVGDPRNNPDLPTLNPYQIMSSGQELERNPYFWKVDENGDQMPYIDVVRDPVAVQESNETFFWSWQRSMCAFVTDIEVWRPYPSQPPPVLRPPSTIIGDAILVPGHSVMRVGISRLREGLVNNEVQINSARTVVLTTEGTTTYLAPRAKPLDQQTFMELATNDGVIIAVAVLDENNHLRIQPGSYLQRVRTDGSDIWYLEYIAQNSELIATVVMEEDEYVEGAFLDEYPTSAIFIGSHKCRSGWRLLGWLRRGGC